MSIGHTRGVHEWHYIGGHTYDDAREIVEAWAMLRQDEPLDVWVNACAHVGLRALLTAMRSPMSRIH